MRFFACTLMICEGMLLEYAWLHSHNPWHYAGAIFFGIIGSETIRAHWSEKPAE
jgi:hypothetical protein